MKNAEPTLNIAPEFTLPFVSNTENGDISLSSLRPNAVVLFFYPRDNTSGCTKEAIEFTILLSEFEKLDAKVFGISTDSIKKHENFITKHDLKVPLICDAEAEACKAFGAWREKSMYGKKFWGIERSTFLISGTGEILKEWRKVKVPNHAQEVLNHISNEKNT